MVAQAFLSRASTRVRLRDLAILFSILRGIGRPPVAIGRRDRLCLLHLMPAYLGSAEIGIGKAALDDAADARKQLVRMAGDGLGIGRREQRGDRS